MWHKNCRKYVSNSAYPSGACKRCVNDTNGNTINNDINNDNDNNDNNSNTNSKNNINNGNIYFCNS